MTLLRGMMLSITPPVVSMPRVRGVTSRRRRSCVVLSLSPERTPACTKNIPEGRGVRVSLTPTQEARGYRKGGVLEIRCRRGGVDHNPPHLRLRQTGRCILEGRGGGAL